MRSGVPPTPLCRSWLVPELRGQVPDVIEPRTRVDITVVWQLPRQSGSRSGNAPSGQFVSCSPEPPPTWRTYTGQLAAPAPLCCNHRSGQDDAVSGNFAIENAAFQRQRQTYSRKAPQSHSSTTQRETKPTQSIPFSEAISSPILQICREMAADKAVGWWHTHTTGSRYGGKMTETRAYAD
jgi:hypothetical protein